MENLGVVRGQLILDVKQAVAAYAAVRAANVATVTAMNRGGAVLRRAGVVMAGAGFALGAGLVYAIKKAADFEKQMDFFGAVSNATASEMDAAREKALQLGKDTKYSASEIADSFIELGKAGVKTQDIVDGIGEGVASLGAAADIPLVNASNIIVSTVQTFGLEANKAVDVADKLAGAANESMVDIEDLGVSLKYVGGVASALGLSFDETNTALALLGKYGIRGSTAGTSLRQMMVGLVGNSKKATDEMKALGIITEEGANQFFDASGKLKPLPKVVDILNESMSNLTQEEKIDTLKKMFNVRALPTILNLMKEGSAGFDKMGTAIEKTKAADVAAKRMDNLAGDVEILTGNLETLAIQAGSPFQEFLRGIVQGLTNVVQWFGNLSPGVQEAIFKFLAITAAVLIFMGTFSIIAGTVFTFVATLMDLWAALKLIKAGLVAAKASMVALNITFLTNPVFLVIAAIIALVLIFVLLYKKNEKFRNFINGIGAAIKTGFIAVVNWFKGLPAWFSNLWNNVKNAFTTAWNAITNFFTNTIPTAFSNAWNSIVNGVSSFISRVVGWFQALPGRIGTFVSNTVSSVVNWFRQLPQRVGYYIGFMVGTMIRKFLELRAKVLATATGIVMGVVNWIRQLPGRVLAFWQSLQTGASNKWNAIKTGTVNKAKEIYNGVVNWVKQLPGRIGTFFEDMKTRAITKANALRTSAVEKAQAIYNGISNWIQKLPGRIAGFFQDMVSKAGAKAEELKTKATNAAKGAYDAFVTWVNKIPETVTGAVGKAIQAFKDMVNKAFNAAKEFASGLWSGFKDGLGINSPSFIEKQMVQITQVVGEETRNLRGQVRGIQRLGGQLTKIPTMEPSDQNLLTSKARSIVASMVAERARLQDTQNRFAKYSTGATAIADRRIAQGVSIASQPAVGSTPSTVRLSDDQLDSLGQKNITVDFTAVNPVEEKSSESLIKGMAKLASLEVI